MGPRQVAKPSHGTEPEPEPESGIRLTNVELEGVLEYLRHSRGADLFSYRRTTLVRGVSGRISELSLDSADEYTQYLERHPVEVARLLDAILINTTSFFRDRPMWDALRSVVVGWLAALPEDGCLRVWAPGCSTGEEASSLALLCAQLFGLSQTARRVRIYATDVDETALARARTGVFDEAVVEGVPADPKRAFLRPCTRRQGCWTLDPELRSSIVFGRHDLLVDPPIAGTHIVLCRNTMMYFTPDAQARLLKRFQFSLVPSGTLVVGMSERATIQSPYFAPRDLEHGMFTLTKDMPTRRTYAEILPLPPPTDSSSVGLLSAALESSGLAQLIFDSEGKLQYLTARAKQLLGMGDHHVGRSYRELELAAWPPKLSAEIDVARLTREPTSSRVSFRGDRVNDPPLDVVVAPLFDKDATLIGFCVTASKPPGSSSSASKGSAAAKRFVERTGGRSPPSSSAQDACDAQADPTAERRGRDDEVGEV